MQLKHSAVYVRQLLGMLASLTSAPTKPTAIIPAELQAHGACQGLKGPAHHDSQFHFYKAVLGHIFI